MPEIGPPGLTGRGLETGLRRPLNGHEAGNGGYGQGSASGVPRQSSTPPTRGRWCLAHAGASEAPPAERGGNR